MGDGDDGVLERLVVCSDRMGDAADLAHVLGAAASISSVVAGGSSPRRVVMLRHMLVIVDDAHWCWQGRATGGASNVVVAGTGVYTDRYVVERRGLPSS